MSLRMGNIATRRATRNGISKLTGSCICNGLDAGDYNAYISLAKTDQPASWAIFRPVSRMPTGRLVLSLTGPAALTWIRPRSGGAFRKENTTHLFASTRSAAASAGVIRILLSDEQLCLFPGLLQGAAGVHVIQSAPDVAQKAVYYLPALEMADD